MEARVILPLRYRTGIKPEGVYSREKFMRGFPTLLLAWHVVCLISKLKCAPEHRKMRVIETQSSLYLSDRTPHNCVSKLSLVRKARPRAKRL